MISIADLSEIVSTVQTPCDTHPLEAGTNLRTIQIRGWINWWRMPRVENFDVVVDRKLGRFGRSLVQCISKIQELASLGIRLFSTPQGLDTEESNSARSRSRSSSTN